MYDIIFPSNRDKKRNKSIDSWIFATAVRKKIYSNYFMNDLERICKYNVEKPAVF